MQDSRSNPTEDVLLGESTGGVGMRTQDWLPRFLQKPQTKGTEAPILTSREFHPSAGVIARSAVADSLTNVPFDGMAGRGDDKDLDTKRLLSDTLYVLRGFGMFQVELGAGQSGKGLVNTMRPASNKDKEFPDAIIWSSPYTTVFPRIIHIEFRYDKNGY